MDVCVPVLSWLFESDFVCELSDVGNERVHMEVCESVNGFTMQLGAKEASENLS